jgi:NAD(P)-dependent dehydrogenase (short-subunit alcohol dehydrogenase family)
MDRIVLITGSTRGIGFSTAQEFQAWRSGGHLLPAQETPKKPLRVFQRLPAREPACLVGDVRKQEHVKRIVSRCLKRFGRIDVLINNAGVASYKPIEQTTEKEWDKIIDTNLKGTFLFLRHTLPIMKSRPRASSSIFLQAWALKQRPTSLPTARRNSA